MRRDNAWSIKHKLAIQPNNRPIQTRPQNNRIIERGSITSINDNP